MGASGGALTHFGGNLLHGQRYAQMPKSIEDAMDAFDPDLLEFIQGLPQLVVMGVDAVTEDVQAASGLPVHGQLGADFNSRDETKAGGDAVFKS